MQSLTEQVQKGGGEVEKLHISRSPKGARLLSRSSDIITTTTPGASLADWQQALRKKPMAMSTVLPHYIQIHILHMYWGWGVRDGAMPGCVSIYTALGSTASQANTAERILKTEYLEF